MDFRVGAPPPVGNPGDRSREMPGRIEARVLAVRQVRSRQSPPPTSVRERRGPDRRTEPAGGRILVLLIPEGHLLPADLESENYRVFLRFARVGKRG